MGNDGLFQKRYQNLGYSQSIFYESLQRWDRARYNYSQSHQSSVRKERDHQRSTAFPNTVHSQMKLTKMPHLWHSLKHRKKRLTKTPSEKCWICLPKLTFSMEWKVHWRLQSWMPSPPLSRPPLRRSWKPSKSLRQLTRSKTGFQNSPKWKTEIWKT